MTREEALTVCYRFADFCIDTRNRVLLRGDQQLPLRPKYFDVLAMLVEHAGQLLTKQTLFETVWRESHVTDSALTQCIKDIRKALGDHASSPRFIKTIPKRGYAFICEVLEVPSPDHIIATPDRQARPFRFLSSFTEADASHFFGREEETRRTVSMATAHPTFLLYGRSGAGKSSLLAAGLAPELKARGYRVFLVVTGERPDLDMNHILTLSRRDGADPVTTMAELLQKGERIVWCFDQFEDLFRLTSDRDRGLFFDILSKLTALAGSERQRFVFVFREDYLAQMNALKRIFPNIFHSEYRLGPLSREKALRAMVEPARLGNCRFESGLTQKILDDLSKDQGVSPPFLQMICDGLFDARTPDGLLTHAAYRELGEAGGILKRYLDRFLLRLPANDYAVAKNILLSLVSPEGARLTRPIEPLCDQVARDFSLAKDRVETVLEELARARIVLVRSEPGSVWAELVHDLLVGSVTRWMTDEQLALARVRDVLTRAERNFMEHGLLMSREEVDLVLKMGSGLQPSGTALDLLVLSCFGRGIGVPEWLARQTPDFERMWRRALKDPEGQTRLTAIEAALWLEPVKANQAWAHAALHDEAHVVRKAAGIALARQNGDGSVSLLKGRQQPGFAGFLRFLVCLAVIRDTDKGYFKLFRHGVGVGIAVMAGLAFVRLRRAQPYWFQQISSGAAGAALGACLFAFVWSLFSGLSLSESIAWASIATFTGLFVGAGIALGIATVEQVGYRHESWWRIPSGMIGGAMAAGLIHWIGHALGQTFLGVGFPDIGGWREGLILATGACGGGFLARLYRKGWSLSGAALACGLAAILVTVLDGNLLAGSIDRITAILAAEGIGRRFSAPFPSGFLGYLVSFIEGVLFGGGLYGGLHLWRRQNGNENPSHM